jgi:hypothetical protein
MTTIEDSGTVAAVPTEQPLITKRGRGRPLGSRKIYTLAPVIDVPALNPSDDTRRNAHIFTMCDGILKDIGTRKVRNLSWMPRNVALCSMGEAVCPELRMPFTQRLATANVNWLLTGEICQTSNGSHATEGGDIIHLTQLPKYAARSSTDPSTVYKSECWVVTCTIYTPCCHNRLHEQQLPHNPYGDKPRKRHALSSSLTPEESGEPAAKRHKAANALAIAIATGRQVGAVLAELNAPAPVPAPLPLLNDTNAEDTSSSMPSVMVSQKCVTRETGDYLAALGGKVRAAADTGPFIFDILDTNCTGRMVTVVADPQQHTFADVASSIWHRFGISLQSPRLGMLHDRPQLAEFDPLQASISYLGENGAVRYVGPVFAKFTCSKPRHNDQVEKEAEEYEAAADILQLTDGCCIPVLGSL